MVESDEEPTAVQVEYLAAWAAQLNDYAGRAWRLCKDVP